MHENTSAKSAFTSLLVRNVEQLVASETIPIPTKISAVQAAIAENTKILDVLNEASEGAVGAADVERIKRLKQMREQADRFLKTVLDDLVVQVQMRHLANGR